ncbi:hypothetical protein EDD28_3347 [Salana multivorans]|uniref:N-acetyltransferase domain-containing protein n=1 Tax=Salana multivorans TaxID=120377 RepID=A0A3N2D2N7_9MICO|nr:hypothetical protein EDD28_3347 [Salana multivorans]
MSVRALTPGEEASALDLCARDPVAAVLAAARIEEGGVSPVLGVGAWGAFEGEELVSLLWLGSNLVPVSPSGRGLAALAGQVIQRTRRFSSVVGDSAAVHVVWSHLAQAMPEPRQVRRQPSLTLTGPPATAPHPLVRPAREDELDILLPASVAMFTEEYGYSPLGSGAGYQRRVRQLVESGRSFVLVEHEGGVPRIVFKAEIGAFALGVAQLQGVWVDPSRRGEGIGAAGTAAVVEHAFALGAETVSLYVNDYNSRARRTYRRVGFTEVGEYTTIVV